MSGIFVQYGTFKHDPGEIEITITRDVILTEAQTPWAYNWRADLLGMLFADSSREMNDKVKAIRAAYAKTRQDFRVVLPDGTDSELSFKSSQANGGIIVSRPPSFPPMINASYVTFLTYQISLTAEERILDIETGLVSFEETISREGGGARFGLLEPLNGRPIRQQLKQNTIFRAVQAGQSVGLYARPRIPLPLFPQALLGAPAVEVSSPDRRGAGADLIFVNFPISWKYEYESATPLFGNPNLFGVS